MLFELLTQVCRFCEDEREVRTKSVECLEEVKRVPEPSLPSLIIYIVRGQGI